MFGNKKKQILAEGTQAWARVTDVHDTGMTVNELYYRVGLTLEVHPDGQPPFEVTKRMTVSRVAIPRVGDNYLIRFDPNDRAKIEFDLEAARQLSEDVKTALAQAAAIELPADLAEHGILGRGACVDVARTPAGRLVDCRLTLGVRLVDGTPPYRTNCELSLAPGNAENILPGRTILTVRADPTDHARIAASMGEQTPSVQVSDAAITDPPARAMREGAPCRVQVLEHADQYLHLPGGEELYATKVRVLDDGSEIQVNLPVPASAMGLLSDGAELPAKRIAYEPGVLVVDWTAASAQAGLPTSP